MAFDIKIEGDTILISDGGVPVMGMQEAVTDQERRAVLIMLGGAVRSDVSDCLEDELNAFVTLDADILIDTRQVSYVSVAAQQCFLRVQRYADRVGKGRLTLSIPDDKLYAQFEETGITELLQIVR